MTARELATKRRRPAPRRERDVQAAILQWLAMQRGFFWRNNTGALRDKTGRLVRYGVPGMPDILGIRLGGRLVAVEVKRPGAKPNPVQRATLDALRGWGAQVILAHDVGDVIRAWDI